MRLLWGIKYKSLFTKGFYFSNAQVCTPWNVSRVDRVLIHRGCRASKLLYKRNSSFDKTLYISYFKKSYIKRIMELFIHSDNHLVLFQIFSYRINLINVLKGTSRDIYKKIPYIHVYFGSVFDYTRIMVMLIKLAQNPCTRL